MLLQEQEKARKSQDKLRKGSLQVLRKGSRDGMSRNSSDTLSKAASGGLGRAASGNIMSSQDMSASLRPQGSGSVDLQSPSQDDNKLSGTSFSPQTSLTFVQCSEPVQHDRVLLLLGDRAGHALPGGLGRQHCCGVLQRDGFHQERSGGRPGVPVECVTGCYAAAHLCRSSAALMLLHIGYGKQYCANMTAKALASASVLSI